MVKLKYDQVRTVLRNVISRVVNDSAMRGNIFYDWTSGNYIDEYGYTFKRYDTGLRAKQTYEQILEVRFTQTGWIYDRNPETDLKLKIGKTEIGVVESDGLTPEEYEKILYNAVRDGLVRSLKEKGYITDESPGMLPATSELHWHAISRLANIIEHSIDSNSSHLRNCSI